MAEIRVGRLDDFSDDGDERKQVVADGREIVVFKHRGTLHAIDNVCLHMGGPVGEGLIIGRVEAVIGDDGTVRGERFSEEEFHIVCPWHGFEYDIATGQCAADRRLRLRKYSVTVKEGEVFVSV